MFHKVNCSRRSSRNNMLFVLRWVACVACLRKWCGWRTSVGGVVAWLRGWRASVGGVLTWLHVIIIVIVIIEILP